MRWRLLVRAVMAMGFGAATAYGIWRAEWFDVFRWGIPGPELLFVYACYVATFATLGWFAAALFTPRPANAGHYK
jgi:hypothetical protein